MSSCSPQIGRGRAPSAPAERSPPWSTRVPEYELELRAERQAEGIAAAQRRQEQGRMLPGKKHIGRPRAIGPAELATLRRLVDEDGKSVTEAARTLKIGRSTAYAALADVTADRRAGGRAERDAVLAALPTDTRPPSSVEPYDQLLTRSPRVGQDQDVDQDGPVDLPGDWWLISNRHGGVHRAPGDTAAQALADVRERIAEAFATEGVTFTERRRWNRRR